jgi:hypothetical protein
MVRREFFASQIYAGFSPIYRILNVGINAAAGIVHRLLTLVYIAGNAGWRVCV